MGNRCDSCNKMVGLENGEPQVDSIEATFDGKDSFDITASVTGTRLCADCNQEMKTLSMEMEGTVALKDMDDYKSLTAEQKAAVEKSIKSGRTPEIDIDGNGGDVEEGGGGRYSKNMITTNIHYSMSVTFYVEDGGDDIVLEHNGNLSSENAAGEFEDY